MPTPSRGIAVRLFPEDRERFLRFSLLTLEAIQDEFGEEAFTTQIRGKKLAKILWYGLKADAQRRGESVDGEGAIFTPEFIGENVDTENMGPVIEALGQAFGAKKNELVPPTPSATQ